MKRLRDSHQDCVYADASSRECFVTTAEDFALACRQCAPRRPAPSTLVELCGLRYSTVLSSRAPQCGVIFVGPVNILRGCYTNQPVVASHSTWLLCVGRAMHQLLVRMMRLLPLRGKFTFGAVTRRLYAWAMIQRTEGVSIFFLNQKKAPLWNHQLRTPVCQYFGARKDLQGA